MIDGAVGEHHFGAQQLIGAETELPRQEAVAATEREAAQRHGRARATWKHELSVLPQRRVQLDQLHARPGADGPQFGRLLLDRDVAQR